jgi:hypothetical protein
MTTTEKIYQLIPTLTEVQLNEILIFAEFLKYKQESLTQPASTSNQSIIQLRGLAKTSETSPSDTELRDEHTNYLIEKYR